MVFWVYMLIVNSLIPLVMIILGRLFHKNMKVNRNSLFGYRTKMSMKSSDTWIFAHKYIGNLWFKWGIPLLVISVGAMLLLYGKGSNMIGILGTLITIGQLFVLVGCIFPTERALKEHFTEDGLKK